MKKASFTTRLKFSYTVALLELFFRSLREHRRSAGGAVLVKATFE